MLILSQKSMRVKQDSSQRDRRFGHQLNTDMLFVISPSSNLKTHAGVGECVPTIPILPAAEHPLPVVFHTVPKCGELSSALASPSAQISLPLSFCYIWTMPLTYSLIVITCSIAWSFEL